jgi:hypothetical protein
MTTVPLTDLAPAALPPVVAVDGTAVLLVVVEAGGLVVVVLRVVGGWYGVVGGCAPGTAVVETCVAGTVASTLPTVTSALFWLRTASAAPTNARSRMIATAIAAPMRRRRLRSRLRPISERSSLVPWSRGGRFAMWGSLPERGPG